MNCASRLALGTVQFGLPYGISNSLGQTTHDQAKLILAHGLEAGIDTLDTAIAYGDSESILGSIGVKPWKVISKLPSIPANVQCIKTWVIQQTRESCIRLGVLKLSALLLHAPEQLLQTGGAEIYQALEALKAMGLVEKIGYSVYDCQDLHSYFDIGIPDIIQVPYNIFDRRVERSGWLQKLQSFGIEVHTRSAFLQGLLLMQPHKRPDKFSVYSYVWKPWDTWLEMNNIDPVHACLRFATTTNGVGKVVIGVNTQEHLVSLLKVPLEPLKTLPDLPDHIEQALINPSQWSTL